MATPSGSITPPRLAQPTTPVRNPVNTTLEGTPDNAVDSIPRLLSPLSGNVNEQTFSTDRVPSSRPTRNRRQRLVYDAHKGSYVQPDSGEDRSAEVP